MLQTIRSGASPSRLPLPHAGLLCGTQSFKSSALLATINLMSGTTRKLRRYEHRNDVRYITCSCYKRLALFQNDAIKDRFVHHLRMAQEDYNYRLYAWVLMPEHFHLLLRPADPDDTMTPIVRRIKAGFAKRVINRWRELNAPILPRITDRSGAIRFWQHGGGYDRNLYSESELMEKIAYIHLNPVKRGLVAAPADWAWSSARAYENGDDGFGLQLTQSP